MALVQKPDKDNLTHVHGVAWVVYGVYEGSIKQTKFRWFYPREGVDSVQIGGTGDFVQDDGKVAFFLPVEIQNTLNITGGRALVVRLESQKLDRVLQYQYNPEEGTVKVIET